MFGGQPGPWDPQQPWNGWWGDDPPFHYPVFVLTHHPRAPLVAKGGTTFHFVTDGIEAALTRARQAAGSRDISLAGGGSAARQCLAAGLVDEMWLHIVPILLGRGERLFDRGLDDLHGLKLVKTVQGDGVVHLKLARA
jgi:dihydrofolate reductase